MQQAEDKAEKEKARAQVLKRLAKAEKAANKTKRKIEEDYEEEDDEDLDGEEDEELEHPKLKGKTRKRKITTIWHTENCGRRQ